MLEEFTDASPTSHFPRSRSIPAGADLRSQAAAHAAHVESDGTRWSLSQGDVFRRRQLHQCDEQRKDWDVLAARLAASGINVLTLDYRGFGESCGTPNDKLTPEERKKIWTDVWPHDIDLAIPISCGNRASNATRFGAGGASCGVNNAIQLARRHPDVKALMLLSGPTDRDGRLFLQSSKGLPIFYSSSGGRQVRQLGGDHAVVV